MPPALAPTPGRLVHTARALETDRHLDILAVGSALVSPHLGADEAFPHRMVDTLRGTSPGVSIHLQMRSERGATAPELLPILRAELARRPYQLVVWQTGTVDAARKARPDEFGRALAEGVALAHTHGSDVILIDPQFSRMLEERADLDPYEDRIKASAQAPETQLFPRFSLMRAWVEAGVLDLEKSPHAERPAMVARLHECLAAALAHAILTGAGQPSRSPAMTQ